MEAVIFCGVQGSGKSTFFRERFFDTHLRLNLDMLRTRHRGTLFAFRVAEPVWGLSYSGGRMLPVAEIYPVAAAGYSLIWLLCGGGFFGAVVIFVVAKMLGR
ncbi:MAG TPA: hypothetical protein VG269_09070 [Tepidisphaeraceae bacterium]|jgi:hypothetical protein|nr:hypothetical protein [Tepidisphaeraceae bacterium]